MMKLINEVFEHLITILWHQNILENRIHQA